MHWYKDAIIYELHIKAFYDANGDGIGDFEGLIEKLDYLEDLGVTAIWLLPFYPSPLRDDGYDIADYYNINPSYGKLEDLKKFIGEAHKRNLRVITELVINHTSDKHPWFERARNAPKGSPERAYYVWTDDPDKYKDVRIIFQDYEASNWTWDPVAKQYYWHRFFHHQPDLNYDNPEVGKEVFKIIDYWCEMGVDGFRLDAVPYLYERDGTNGENLPETHAYLKKLRAHVDKKFPGTLLLAEANMWPEDSASYFGDGDECHMNYHFPVMPRMFMALNMEDRYPITDIFDQTPEIPENCQWAIFLRNHDELTLEMVTDEERDYMYKAYAKNPRAKINLGIRHRLSPLMKNDRRKVELLNHLLFSLPGTPVIYYGDEIGMGDNLYLGDRDGVRTPMQWTPDRNAGFSKTNPHKLYLPVIIDPDYTYEAINVETQRRNSSSLLWWMKRTINMRKKYKAFGWGDLNFIHSENAKVLAFTRTYEEETILVVVNLSRYTQSADLDLSEFGGFVPTEIFSKNEFPEIRQGTGYAFTLMPYAYHWFYLENVHGTREEMTRVKIEVDRELKNLLNERAKLETKVLPTYLKSVAWFAGKGRKMKRVEIDNANRIDTDNESFIFLNLAIEYESGLPEHYLLPVSFTSGLGSERLQEIYPDAIICDMNCGTEDGNLYDGYYSASLQRYLLKMMLQNERLELKDVVVNFESVGNDLPSIDDLDKIRSRVHPGEHSNTSIVYEHYFFLKIYRKLDVQVNPDLEINRFLHEKAKFDYIPNYHGAISWSSNGAPVILGMLQEQVHNQGELTHFMSDQLRKYYERILSKDLESDQSAESILDTPRFEDLTEEERVMLELHSADRAELLGERTAQLHKALTSDSTSPEFSPEPFSLHYQRSLYSSFQTLVRSTFDLLVAKSDQLDEDHIPLAKEIIPRKSEVLTRMKRIYDKKFDISKLRVHGDFHLDQVLYTGRDFVFIDFEGEPRRTISERRLKRSPLRDVASMIRSFHYVAYSEVFLDEQYSDEDLRRILPWADRWYRRMSGFFMKSYLKHTKGTQFVPEKREDLEVILNTFLLEKAIYEVQHELVHRPYMVEIPLIGLRELLDG